MVFTGILMITLSIMLILIIKTHQWETYSKKKVVYQILSLIIVLIRGPLFSIVCLFILHSFFSFEDLESAYLKSISMTCTFISTAIMAIYTYFGSYLFNLTIPNDLIPWSCTSHQPYLMQCLFKLFLMLTLKLRNENLALLYSLSTITALVCMYRLYLLLHKS